MTTRNVPEEIDSRWSLLYRAGGVATLFMALLFNACVMLKSLIFRNVIAVKFLVGSQNKRFKNCSVTVKLKSFYNTLTHLHSMSKYRFRPVIWKCITLPYILRVEDCHSPML
jgi:hypothetical protein